MEEKKTEEENIWQRSLQKLSRILRSLGFGFSHGLGLGTFANFWRVTVSASENLVSQKSLGFDFGKFVIGKKVSVSVTVKILVSSFSAASACAQTSHYAYSGFWPILAYFCP